MVRSEVKVLRRQDLNRKRFGKIAWSNFERAKHDPKGGGQESGVILPAQPCNLCLTTWKVVR